MTYFRVPRYKRRWRWNDSAIAAPRYISKRSDQRATHQQWAPLWFLRPHLYEEGPAESAQEVERERAGEAVQAATGKWTTCMRPLPWDEVLQEAGQGARPREGLTYLRGGFEVRIEDRPCLQRALGAAEILAMPRNRPPRESQDGGQSKELVDAIHSRQHLTPRPYWDNPTNETRCPSRAGLRQSNRSPSRSRWVAFSKTRFTLRQSQGQQSPRRYSLCLLSLFIKAIL